MLETSWSVCLVIPVGLEWCRNSLWRALGLSFWCSYTQGWALVKFCCLLIAPSLCSAMDLTDLIVRASAFRVLAAWTSNKHIWLTSFWIDMSCQNTYLSFLHWCKPALEYTERYVVYVKMKFYCRLVDIAQRDSKTKSLWRGLLTWPVMKSLYHVRDAWVSGLRLSTESSLWGLKRIVEGFMDESERLGLFLFSSPSFEWRLLLAEMSVVEWYSRFVVVQCFRLYPLVIVSVFVSDRGRSIWLYLQLPECDLWQQKSHSYDQDFYHIHTQKDI